MPFTRTPAKPDPKLEAKLRAEAAGILRWMIDGCLDWQANGLVRPQSVVEATEESVVNSLWAAEDVEGREGRVIRALPHEPVLGLLRAAGRI